VNGVLSGPSAFVLIDRSESRIIGIRDFLFAPCVLKDPLILEMHRELEEHRSVAQCIVRVVV
jgi:hypothetical protein